MKECFTPTAFRAPTLRIIDQANEIIDEYATQGFNLTLRQLFYQFVARALLTNLTREYRHLGRIINTGRLAGMIDWESIVDHTRNLRSLPNWNGPAEIMRSAAESFRIDRWAGQQYRPEVWIEKDALVGVIEDACDNLFVPFFSCRGFNSQSEMWGAGRRFKRYLAQGQRPIVFHLADHDPAGIAMTRDIVDRLALFCGSGSVIVSRIALDIDQVRQYSPPPNFAKEKDSRYKAYVEEYGRQCWELDALAPTVIAGLITDAVTELIDRDSWESAAEHEAEQQRLLALVADRWDDVVAFVDGTAA